MSIARTTRNRRRGPTTLLAAAATIVAAAFAVLCPAVATAHGDTSPARFEGKLAATGWHGREIRAPHEHRPPSAPFRADPIRLWTGYRTPGGSDRVRVIQRQLRQLGYRPGPVDGFYGPRTAGAVRWFEIKHGFRPAPTVAPEILRHLRARTRERAVQPPESTPPPATTVPPPQQRPAAPRRVAADQGPVAPPLGAVLDFILVGLALLGVAAFALSYRRTRARLSPTRVEVRPTRARRLTAPGDVARPPEVPATTTARAGPADDDTEAVVPR